MNQIETRKVRRGRIFPEIQWSEAQLAQWQAERAARRQRCQMVFDRLKPELLETHYNWFMAIEPESGDYFLHQDEEIATQMARQKHQSAKIVMFVINETGVSGKI